MLTSSRGLRPRVGGAQVAGFRRHLNSSDRIGIAKMPRKTAPSTPEKSKFHLSVNDFSGSGAI